MFPAFGVSHSAVILALLVVGKFDHCLGFQCGTNSSTGLYCVSRTQVGICVGVYNDGNVKSTFKNLEFVCPQDSVCVSGFGCKKDAALLSRDRPFACSDSGLFPDPRNSSVYHNCTIATTGSGLFVDNKASCAEGMTYNVTKGGCDASGRTFSVSCSSEFEVGTLFVNSRIFYVCVTESDYPGDLSPNFYNCPGVNQTLNPAVLSCASANVDWGSLPTPSIL